MRDPYIMLIYIYKRAGGGGGGGGLDPEESVAACDGDGGRERAVTGAITGATLSAVMAAVLGAASCSRCSNISVWAGGALPALRDVTGAQGRDRRTGT